MRQNYSALKYANPYEWSLLRALVSTGCLNEELAQIEKAFYGIDVLEPDGSIDLDKVIKMASESDIFVAATPGQKASETPGLEGSKEKDEDQITIEDLQDLF